MSQPAADPRVVIDRIHKAWNAHDITALMECIDPDFSAVQPMHPARTFRGSEQVRRNWTKIFHDVPDLRAELLRAAVHGDVVWTEWRWYGTVRADGMPYDVVGVMIFGTDGERVTWSRVYSGPVEVAGPAMDAALDADLRRGPRD